MKGPDRGDESASRDGSREGSGQGCLHLDTASEVTTGEQRGSCTLTEKSQHVGRGGRGDAGSTDVHTFPEKLIINLQN